MNNRICGILLILLSITLIIVLALFFPCDIVGCVDVNCKDITGLLFPMLLGVPIVIDSLIHKDKMEMISNGVLHISKEGTV